MHVGEDSGKLKRAHAYTRLKAVDGPRADAQADAGNRNNSERTIRERNQAMPDNPEYGSS